jgi:hypothetical protein
LAVEKANKKVIDGGGKKSHLFFVFQERRQQADKIHAGIGH